MNQNEHDILQKYMTMPNVRAWISETYRDRPDIIMRHLADKFPEVPEFEELAVKLHNKWRIR